MMNCSAQKGKRILDISEYIYVEHIRTYVGHFREGFYTSCCSTLPVCYQACALAVRLRLVDLFRLLQEMQASLRNSKAHGLIFSTPIQLLQIQMLKSLQTARNLSETDNCEQFQVSVGLHLKEKPKENVEKYMKKITAVLFEQL